MKFKVIVKGRAEGNIMKSIKPINFLGAIDKHTGQVKDENHELYQKTIKDSILVFPHGIGSSVGAYTIYSLKKNNSAPKAMICIKPDLTVASGCALANIPLVVIENINDDAMTDGRKIILDTNAENLN